MLLRLTLTSPEEPPQHLPGGGDRKVQYLETSRVPVMRARDSSDRAGGAEEPFKSFPLQCC